uniref:ATP synthase complex subunit 8 n=1 Tax=Eubasilissa sinensis TaxID=2904901 RepID=A0A9E8LNW4_9NEOP|nr:ATP synthase F0 subunit 8 [Eubasilissa sinensis]UZZ43925.1 ATP synthase F0 subunit 8 [Eubasilissa sinensis]
MPQMMPLNWLFLFFMFIIFLILFLIMNYFIYNPNLSSSKILITPQKINWKW